MITTPYSVDSLHWLNHTNIQVPKIDCAYEKYSSGNNICDYIIFHYTASGTLESAHNTYKAKDTSVSWHLTIDTDGKVYQLLDFRKKAWHAGISNWKRPDGLETGGLNKWAIGIEMINPGPLKKLNGKYYTWYNEIVDETKVYRDENEKYWHTFSAEQKATAKAIVPALIKKYKCLDVMGHEHISPGRKQDPGPAFWYTLAEIKKENFG